jgi:hypothetical protein
MKGTKLLIATAIIALPLCMGATAVKLTNPAKHLTLTETATLMGNLPGSPLGDSFGQVMHFDKKLGLLFVDAFLTVPSNPSEPNKIAVGAVYVYKYNASTQGWDLQQTILTNGNLDHLGAVTVKTWGDWLFIPVIGTPAGQVAGGDTFTQQNFMGSIQIYQYNHSGPNQGQYTFVQALDSTTTGINLTPCDPVVVNDPGSVPANTVEQGAAFGLSFTILHDRGILVVGAATQENNGNINSGDVYVFQLQNGQWHLNQTIPNPDGSSANDTFGGVVRSSGDLLAISNSAQFTDGRFSLDVNAQLITHVYLFKYNPLTGLFVYTNNKVTGDQTLGTPYVSTQPGGLGSNVIGANFGANVVFHGNYLLVSAPFENLGNGTPQGAAFLYQINPLTGAATFVKKFVSNDPKSFFFGWGLELDDTHVYVGDPIHTGPAPANNLAQGGVVIFKNEGGSWNYETTLFDTQGGQAYDLLGSAIGKGSIAISGAGKASFVVPGTAKGDPLIFLSILPTPVLLPFPTTLTQDKAVVFQKE